MRSIPVVDYLDFTTGDEERKSAFIQSVGDSLKEIGFFALKNHGIPLSAIEQSYEQGDAFFSMSDEVKKSYLQPEIAHQRGYTAFGIEHAKNNPAPDLKEFWQTGRSHPTSGKKPTYVENVWPNRHLPEFKGVIDGLFTQMEGLSQHLLESCSLYLGKPESWLGSMAEDGNTIMRIIHYPPIPPDAAERVRAGAHEDINLITLLLGADEGGLQLLGKDGKWLEVNPPPGCVTCNIGDMLQRLSNHKLPSTTHRVVNPPAERAHIPRYSMPYFLHPNPDFIIETLESCISAENPNRYPEPISSDEYLQERLREIKLKS